MKNLVLQNFSKTFFQKMYYLKFIGETRARLVFQPHYS